MESISKKKEVKAKIEYHILIIDDDEIATTKIRTSLLCNTKIRYKIFKSCDNSEIKRKILTNSVDIIFYGLKVNDKRSYLIAGTLQLPLTPPLIILKDDKLSRVPSGIEFQPYLLKCNLNTKSITETIHRYSSKNIKKRSIEDSIKELQTSELHFLDIIFGSPDGILIVNKFKKILFANPAATSLLCEDKNLQMAEIVPFPLNNKAIQEITLNKIDRIIEVRINEIHWNTDQVKLLSIRDITSRKRAEIALKQSTQRYELAIKGSKSILWDWNLETDNLHFNGQIKKIFDLENRIEMYTSKDWFSSIHSSDLKKLKQRLNKHLEGQSVSFECEYRTLKKNDKSLWIHIRGEASRNRLGKAVRITGLLDDITEQKKAECQLKKSLDDLQFALASEKILMDELDKKNKELIELSITDGLTGLYNHRFLQERFDFEYKRVKRYGGFLSCMMIDIDHFKSINDTYGHQFGDQVLRQLSDLLKANSREVDICGRYGGEEFMIITNLLADDTLRFATKLHTSIEKHEFECGQKKIHVTVSIGISEYQTEIKSKQQLIERADTALYQAKTDGRNLIRVWKKIENIDDYLVDNYNTESIKSKFMDLSNQVRSTYVESTNALVKAVDAKDPFAKEHSNNVSKYSVIIAKALGLNPEDIEVIRCAAILHDVGKISVKDEILTKKDSLTLKELNILKRHPEVGVNILKDMKFLEKEIPIILHHHERHDGKGYPYGLKDKEIPVGARIVAVADAMDAMTSGRTYRKRLSWKIAIREIEKGKGNQFAPDIVDKVIELYESGNFIISRKSK